MIDISRLKYYKELCDKGVLDKDQNDLDGIMNTLEEKQFEYLKRLETASNEARKEEINGILNVIDLQLKEASSLKSAISSGIIVAENYSPEIDLETSDEKYDSVDSNKDSKEPDANKTENKGIKIVFAVIAICAVIVGIAVLTYDKGGDNAITGGDSTEQTSEDEGVPWDAGIVTVQNLPDASPEFTPGLYVVDITNQTMIDGGLEIGDRLVSLNGKYIGTTWEQYYAVLNEEFEGLDNYKWDMTLVVNRNGEEVTVVGKIVQPSELLPEKHSGTETFYVDGRRITMTYPANEGEDYWFEW